MKVDSLSAQAFDISCDEIDKDINRIIFLFNKMQPRRTTLVKSLQSLMTFYKVCITK